MVGLRCFFLDPPKSFLSKMERKLRGEAHKMNFQKYPSRWTSPPMCWFFFFFTNVLGFFFSLSFFDFVWMCQLSSFFFFFLGAHMFIFLLILVGFCFCSLFFLENSFGLIFYAIFFFFCFNEVSIYTQFFKSIMCYFLFYLIGT